MSEIVRRSRSRSLITVDMPSSSGFVRGGARVGYETTGTVGAYAGEIDKRYDLLDYEIRTKFAAKWGAGTFVVKGKFGDADFGKGGVAEGLSAGKIVVDMSSISPMATKQFAQQINALGCDYLDAPVSGGEVGAKAGSLTIMVGGPEAAFERVKPLFEAMGKNITLVGGNGDGQTTKVANQIIVALNIEAVAEALLFASKAGADPAKVRQALMGGFAASRILEVHGERMIKRTFNPGFRIELHQKDLNLALEGAKALGLSLPHTASAAQLMNSCVALGGAAWDHSGLVRALETAANYQIAGN